MRGTYVFKLIFNTAAFGLIEAYLVMVYFHRLHRGVPDAWHALKLGVTIAFFFLPVASQSIFQGYRCQQYDDGDYEYLLVDHSINCQSELYRPILLYAQLCTLIFPVGMVGSATCQLLRMHSAIEASGGDYANTPGLSTSPMLPLFANQRPHQAWWYVPTDMLRRLMLTCLTLVFVHKADFVLFAVFVAFTCANKASRSRSRCSTSSCPRNAGKLSCCSSSWSCSTATWSAAKTLPARPACCSLPTW